MSLDNPFARMVELSNRAFAKRREISKERVQKPRLAPPLADDMTKDAAVFWKTVFRSLPAAILVGDAQGNLLETNVAGAGLLGYAPATLRSLTVIDVVAAREAWTVSEFGRFTRDESWHGDLDLRRQDGSVIQAEAVASMAGPSAFVAIIQDVSGHKLATAHHRDFFDQAVRDLRHSMTPLLDLTNSLSRLAGLGDAPLVEMQLRVQDLASRIDQLVDASNVERRRHVLAKRVADLAEVLELAVDDVRRQTKLHTISLLSPHGVLDGRWDVERITQVVMSLLANAIQSSPLGGAIRVTATDFESDVLVSVTDEGAGFLDAELPYLFRRIGSAGASLSLYLSRRLVEEHGGHMWATSEGLGRGATFYFSLPRWREELNVNAG